MLSRRSLTIAWTVTAALVLALLAVGAYTTSTWPFTEPDPGSAESADPSPSPTPSASASPVATPSATEDPPAATEPGAPTEEPVPTETAEPTPPTSQAVGVVITYAAPAPDGSGIEVGAYAAIIEDAAQCTLTLTKGSTVRTRTTDAVADVRTMTCGQFLIPASEVSKGTWSAVVTYSSAASSGQSVPSEVVVP